MSCEKTHTTQEPPSKLDLCFVCDTTGSMSRSIFAVQTHLKAIAEAITASEKRDLQLACVEYKDHCDPIVVGSEDFTPSVSKLKGYIDHWQATGGGDHPEAIADGLLAASKLSWRTDATKMLVLCSDAPPHGVGASGDMHPNGCPKGHDPLMVARELVKKEIIMYTVGVNNPDRHTVSFLCTLSRMSGGRYLPLAEASSLPTILLGGAEEEVELAKFEKMMDEEEEIVKRQAREKGEELEVEELSKRVATNLAKREVKVSQLQVSSRGGGELWQKQEEFLSAQPCLSAYNSAQSKVDYSDIPSHDGGSMGGGYGGPFSGGYGDVFASSPMMSMPSACPPAGGYGDLFGAPPMMSPSSSLSAAPPMMSSAPPPSSAPPSWGAPPMMFSPPPHTSALSPSSALPPSSAPQAQTVQQVSDYIQPEHVTRYMNRKNNSYV